MARNTQFESWELDSLCNTVKCRGLGLNIECCILPVTEKSSCIKDLTLEMSECHPQRCIASDRCLIRKYRWSPDTLEEAVQDYINRNVDLYDAPGMVSDVIRRLNCNPNLYLPPDTTFAIIQPFIRECVKVAWQMSALAHSLDIAVASRAELYDDSKYRRSYDSEYTAPLVNHHIWPALVKGKFVKIKGECCTKRGASLSRRSRSPTRSRSVSPGPRSRSRSRSVSPSRRSRSPSPRRLQAKAF